MLKLLLDAGANPNALTSSGKTLVSIAVTSGNLEALHVLLDYKANFDVPDNGSSTPLMWAVQNTALANGLDILKVLLDSNLNVNYEDDNGMTAFDRLCQSRGDLSFAKVLIGAGARVQNIVPRHETLTSLMRAAQHGNSDLCEYLIIEKGCDPHIKNSNGYRY